MGISLSVGILHSVAGSDREGLRYHREAFTRLHEALAAQGIDWREPEPAESADAPRHYAGFPARHLTHLRRSYVLHRWEEPVTPALTCDPAQYARDLRWIEDETSMLSSHLLCHSDTAGYYLPVDLDDPLFLPAGAGVDGGGIVGSSRRLLAELRSFAPAIGVRLDPDGTLGAEESARLAAHSPDDPFQAEAFAWLHLHLACRASLASGHAVVLH
ncbi:hypothetical protein [Kitasatospora sp. NPDC088346]|uniref:hypothetical protein n=1 Tax=Kitasatospora sp. NPDC088346 TaxID=3364073 RepID=UPI0037FCDB69